MFSGTKIFRTISTAVFMNSSSVGLGSNVSSDGGYRNGGAERVLLINGRCRWGGCLWLLVMGGSPGRRTEWDSAGERSTSGVPQGDGPGEWSESGGLSRGPSGLKR